MGSIMTAARSSWFFSMMAAVVSESLKGATRTVFGDGAGDAATAGVGLGEGVEGAGGIAHEGVVAGAVEAAFKLQDFVAAAEGAGDAEGLEASVGAAGGEADFVGAGEGADKLFGELDGVLDWWRRRCCRPGRLQ